MSAACICQECGTDLAKVSREEHDQYCASEGEVVFSTPSRAKGVKEAEESEMSNGGNGPEKKRNANGKFECDHLVKGRPCGRELDSWKGYVQHVRLAHQGKQPLKVKAEALQKAMEARESMEDAMVGTRAYLEEKVRILASELDQMRSEVMIKEAVLTELTAVLEKMT